VAPSAELPLLYLFHGYLVRPRLHDKYFGMAVTAGKPLCMGIVRIDYIRQIPFDLEYDIEIDHRGWRLLWIQRVERLDEALTQCLDPIDITGIVFGEYLQRDGLLLLGRRLGHLLLLCMPLR